MNRRKYRHLSGRTRAKKEEKRLARMLYRKGLIAGCNIRGCPKVQVDELYWAWYHHTPSGAIPQLYSGYVDYWGEGEEFPVVDSIFLDLMWKDVPDILDPEEVDYRSLPYAKTFRQRMALLRTMPTIRTDHKINRALRLDHNPG